jgi:hypothetical protein
VLWVAYATHSTLKPVEQFPDINKLCNVASCWIYTFIGIYLRCADPYTLSPNNTSKWQMEFNSEFKGLMLNLGFGGLNVMTCALNCLQSVRELNKKIKTVYYNVKYWRVRVTLVAVETQQCILCVLLSPCHCRTTMPLCQIHVAGNNAYCPVLHRLSIVLMQTHGLN